MINSPRVGRIGLALLGLLLLPALISGCGNASPIAASTAPAQPHQVQTVAFDLYTHCGINELSASGKYFQRVGGILDDGSHNPPSGWGNPTQTGTLTLSGDIAVFRDKLGHVETFKVRPKARGFLDICS